MTLYNFLYDLIKSMTLYVSKNPDKNRRNINNSRTPAFGGISLALRGRGAFGATFGPPPPSAAVKGKEKKKIWGAYDAPNGLKT